MESLLKGIDIVRGYVPGALGRVVELHGLYYSQHWGFGLYFESRVASGMAEFLERYDEDKDSVWFVTVDGTVEGSVAIDGKHAQTEGAHLRWYIISDKLRGTGTGKNLLNTAVEFCRQRDYKSVYLHTFEGLDAAKHLYEKIGFQLVSQKLGMQWGKEVNEQRFLLEFS